MFRFGSLGTQEDQILVLFSLEFPLVLLRGKGFAPKCSSKKLDSKGAGGPCFSLDLGARGAAGAGGPGSSPALQTYSLARSQQSSASGPQVCAIRRRGLARASITLPLQMWSTEGFTWELVNGAETQVLLQTDGRRICL